MIGPVSAMGTRRAKYRVQFRTRRWLLYTSGATAVLIPAVSVSQWGVCVSNSTGKCVVAMLASEALAITPVVLYPVQFTAELRIEQENVSRTPLQSLVDESSRF